MQDLVRSPILLGHLGLRSARFQELIARVRVWKFLVKMEDFAGECQPQ